MKSSDADNQSVITLVISEPWTLAGITLHGTRVKDIEGPDGRAYSLLRLSDTEASAPGLMISPRYAKPDMDDLRQGKPVYVGIARIVDVSIYEQDHFESDQIDYFAIGSALLA